MGYFEELQAMEVGVDPACISRQDDLISGVPGSLLADFIERNPHLTDRVLELRKEAFIQS